MIKATELRIKNKVFYRPWNNPIAKDEIVTISWVSDDSAGYYEQHEASYPHSESEYSGIPLTPEILEKCGFEPMRSEDDDPDYAATGWRANYNAPYNVGGKDHFCIWDNQPDGYLMDNYSAAPLEYFHQLQNLYFALTGEEFVVNI